MIKVAQELESELSQEQRQDLKEMIDLLQGWQGSMDFDSVAATAYTFALNDFLASLLHAYVSNPVDRLMLLDGYW